MISQTAEYALRAVAHLARQPGEPATTKAIAEATQVPVGYLAKVLKQLAAAGLVTSRRGLHGGYRLARPPDRLPVIEVVNAVSPLPRIHDCPLGIHDRELCPLHRFLDDAMAGVEQACTQVTIGQLTQDDSGLCLPPVGNGAESP
jgi:Rrf2 family protein